MASLFELEAFHTENYISLFHFKRNTVFFEVPNRKRHFNSGIHNEREPKPIGAKQ